MIAQIIGDRAAGAGNQIIKQGHVFFGVLASRALKEEHDQSREDRQCDPIVNSLHMPLRRLLAPVNSPCYVARISFFNGVS